jgi:hypothetical protein
MLVFVLVRAATACGPPPGLYGELPIGWTTDSRYFVFRATSVGDSEEDTRVIGVIDTRTDQTEVMSEARFAKWKTDFPMAPPNGSVRCGGSELVAKPEDLGGSWFGASLPAYREGAPPKALTDGGLTLPPGPPLVVTLGARSGDKTWVHAEFSTSSRMGWHADLTVRPVWSPDCRFVGWVLSGYRPSSAATGPWRPDRAALVGPVGPTIHIMAHRSAPEVVDPIADALRGAGFAPHVGAKALKDREATVVYTSGAAKAEAARIAAVIPGGATVEPLTWPTPADLVVAAGRTAAP